MSAPVYLALLHHPVTDRTGAIVTSALTNMDIHDIARAGRTYGVRRFFVVHPVPALRGLATKVVEHWRTGHGSRYNPSRREAIETVEITADLDHAIAAIEQDSGSMPLLVATSARGREGMSSFAALRRKVESEREPILLLLGTGFGLAPALLERCDLQLEPIVGVAEYNHLSVRAAAAIMLDRLLAPRAHNGESTSKRT